MIVCSVLAATPLYTHIGRRWAFYYMVLWIFVRRIPPLMLHQTSCIGGLSGLIMAWANELNGHDNESMWRPLSLGCPSSDILDRASLCRCEL
jgi:ACS family pantothenate transporter-like MFS transporter